jgi:hypothetical protein
MGQIASMRHTKELFVAVMFLASCQRQPEREVSASVISISPRVSRWHANEALVIYQSADGLMGKKTIPVSAIRCKVGDTVRAHASGISLRMDEQACL